MIFSAANTHTFQGWPAVLPYCQLSKFKPLSLNCWPPKPPARSDSHTCCGVHTCQKRWPSCVCGPAPPRCPPPWTGNPAPLPPAPPWWLGPAPHSYTSLFQTHTHIYRNEWREDMKNENACKVVCFTLVHLFRHGMFYPFLYACVFTGKLGGPAMFWNHLAYWLYKSNTL